MKTSNAVVGILALIAVLALAAAGTGLFYGDGGSPFATISVRGQPMEIYGQGLYRYDTLFQGAGTRGPMQSRSYWVSRCSCSPSYSTAVARYAVICCCWARSPGFSTRT